MAEEQVVNQETTQEVVKETAIPEVDVNALKTGEGVIQNPVVKENPIEEVVKEEPLKEGVQEVVEDYKLNSMWDKAKNELGDKFVIPEGVNEENEYEMFSKAFKGDKETIEGEGIQTDDDEFISSYRKARENEDFDVNKWLEAKNKDSNMINLSDKDFLKAHFEKKDGLKSDANPRGWEKEELDDYIDEMNIGDSKRMANDLRTEYEKNQSLVKEQLTAKQEADYNSHMEEVDAVRNTELDNLFGKTKDITDIYGLEIGKAEIESLQTKFKDWVTPKEGQSSKAYEHFFTEDSKQSLESNLDLFKYFVLKARGDTAFSSALTGIKESVKEDILNKTDLNKKVQSGGISTEYGIDTSALKGPDTDN